MPPESLAHYKWTRANTTYIGLKFNNKKDADIIEHLNKQKNKQGYIKALIRSDIEENKNNK